MPYAASSECHFLPSMVILGEHLGVILSLTKQIGLYSDGFLATYHSRKGFHTCIHTKPTLAYPQWRHI